MSPGLLNSLSGLYLIGPIIDFRGISVRSAVSIIHALEKCASWAFNQSTQWCRLKSSCDMCLSPRASGNSCRHSRSYRSNYFMLSRYRVRLVSVGLSTLLLSTTTTEDTTELWVVDDSASSASIGVDPGSLVRLLHELSLESTLTPRDLVAKKGGIGGGPKASWDNSSGSASSVFMCLWKTPFNHYTPLGLSKWMPSEDTSSGKDRSIMSATSNNLTGSTLLCCIC